MYTWFIAPEFRAVKESAQGRGFRRSVRSAGAGRDPPMCGSRYGIGDSEGDGRTAGLGQQEHFSDPWRSGAGNSALEGESVSTLHPRSALSGADAVRSSRP